MGFTQQLFGSHVAWRMFGSFVVASLVPLLGFSWLATNRVGAALEQETFERLGELLVDLERERVETLRPIERDREDAFGQLESK